MNPEQKQDYEKFWYSHTVRDQSFWRSYVQSMREINSQADIVELLHGLNAILREEANIRFGPDWQIDTSWSGLSIVDVEEERLAIYARGESWRQSARAEVIKARLDTALEELIYQQKKTHSCSSCSTKAVGAEPPCQVNLGRTFIAYILSFVSSNTKAAPFTLGRLSIIVFRPSRI